ncbi:serine/threonine-protein kinase [Actinomadura macrotermitis]|uniref:Serine/threonine-protein kinase PknD n=1 Tax=Actinomadura macrotermitis TaxID=2585200 RepID=A0A7K0BP17_9ACTN|nr:serine/threonine-protein kinase [Actinomadura macrotermitis]MQY02938.1 Serine/threonine-protein kinase PknD [Actinomadura macrotermitis]
MAAGEALHPDDPERIGSYTLLGRLGAGGQGIVYAARGPAGETVAVKLLRSGFGDDRDARARFLRELETAKRVARFCTAAVLDADVAGDRPYIVSEYVDGPSLQAVVRDQGPRGGGALERLAVGTATALVTIHQAGVVHRDLKPHNVLLGSDGPRVIDFGIARALDGVTLTASGVVGTPAYMAPEQLSGERAGPPADVFAWAGTMVFASCGRPPFGDDNMPAVIGRILHGTPELGGLAGPLRDLAARCLDKDPARRPAASEVLRALLGEQAPQGDGTLPPATLLAGAAVAEQPPTAPPFAQPTVRQHAYPPAEPARREPARRNTGTVVAVSAAVIAVAAAVVVAVLALKGSQAKDEPKAAAAPPSSPPASSPAPASAPPASTPSEATSDPAAPPGFSAAYAGRWGGQVKQNDGKVFPVDLTLPAGARQGAVTYPTFGCTGTLTLINDAAGALTVRENITTGRCVPVGLITLTPAGAGAVTFNYSATSKGRTWAVIGPLTRR